MRGKDTRTQIFRLCPEAQQALRQAALRTGLSENDLVNYSVILFCNTDSLLTILTLTHYATRRRRKI